MAKKQEPTVIAFEAEVKSAGQYKAASNDNVYKLVLVSDNPVILELGKQNPEKTVGVAITTEVPKRKLKLEADDEDAPENDLKEELFPNG